MGRLFLLATALAAAGLAFWVTHVGKTAVPELRHFARDGRTFVVSAFLVQGDPNSLNAFEANAKKLDLVFPDWYFVFEASCFVKDRPEESVRRIAEENGVALVPRVTNDGSAAWHVNELKEILHSPQLRTCLAQRLAELASRDHVAGLNLDMEGIGIEEATAYRDFVKLLARKLHVQGQILVVDVPVGDQAFRLQEIAAAADGVMLMVYDQSPAGGPPGPISGYQWFEEALREAAANVPRDKLLAGLGAYGYKWTDNSSEPAQSVSFAEAIGLAWVAQAAPDMEPESRNMRFVYADDDGSHQVWFLNGPALWNLWFISQRQMAAGVAVWRLGMEDPSIWNFLGNEAASASKLESVAELPVIAHVSTGEIYRLYAAPQPGIVEFSLDTEGLINSARYAKLPLGYVLGRVSRTMPEKTLVLTFDDGPDPDWTPKLLDLLDRHKIPAAFFVLGEQVRRHPEILRRIARRGDVIGNHTYHHSDPTKISSERLRKEIADTDAAIVEAAGFRPTLFRVPYDVETEPDTLEQMKIARTVAEAGLAVAGAAIDSFDWKREGAERIVANIEAGLADPRNHLILLHDSGGDREQTLRALEKLIPDLQARGYKFIGLPEAMGVAR